MDFRFNEEQQLWYETLQAFMDKEVGREYTREHDESREFPYEVYRKIADNGWLGLLIPAIALLARTGPDKHAGISLFVARSSASRSPSSRSCVP